MLSVNIQAHFYGFEKNYRKLHAMLDIVAVLTNELHASHLYYENLPMQYTGMFLALKIENFQLKKKMIFFLFLLKT